MLSSCLRGTFLGSAQSSRVTTGSIQQLTHTSKYVHAQTIYMRYIQLAGNVSLTVQYVQNDADVAVTFCRSQYMLRNVNMEVTEM